MSNSQPPSNDDSEDVTTSRTEDSGVYMDVETHPPTDIFPVLWRDVAVLLSLAKNSLGPDREALHRAFVRAGMSLVEATIWFWKDTAIFEDRLNAATNDMEPELSEGERARLRNIEYVLRDSGIVTERPAWNELVADLKLALRSVAKVRGLSYDAVSARLDFNAVNAARKVRNRLTHPKSPDDLLVRDEDVSAVKQALDTIHGAINELSLLMITYSDGSTSLDPIPWNRFESHTVTRAID